jgi:hypothetical protein
MLTPATGPLALLPPVPAAQRQTPDPSFTVPRPPQSAGALFASSHAPSKSPIPPSATLLIWGPVLANARNPETETEKDAKPIVPPNRPPGPTDTPEFHRRGLKTSGRGKKWARRTIFSFRGFHSRIYLTRGIFLPRKGTAFSTRLDARGKGFLRQRAPITATPGGTEGPFFTATWPREGPFSRPSKAALSLADPWIPYRRPACASQSRGKKGR